MFADFKHHGNLIPIPRRWQSRTDSKSGPCQRVRVRVPTRRHYRLTPDRNLPNCLPWTGDERRAVLTRTWGQATIRSSHDFAPALDAVIAFFDSAATSAQSWAKAARS